MALQVRIPVGGRPWADQVARYIPDPVARLRFLKAVAPGLSAEKRARRRWVKRLLLILVVSAAALVSFAFFRGSAKAGPRLVTRKSEAAVRPVERSRNGADVWRVEQSAESETFSNGLRVDTHFTIATHARRFLAFGSRPGQLPERRGAPVGIVFHATESQQAPFEARENGVLKRIGESLLEYVRRRRSYNFVIDRFGRVYRVVPEDQVANHAGHSLWGDETWAYVNLNESFLGVSFEAETRKPDLSPAQVRSAVMLLEMLRSRYRIAAGNCVTHAQVSVNPSNMRVGYHVDWASGFPFGALGLPDNYAVALPALWRFGFESDEKYRGAAGVGLQIGIENAEYRLDEDAHAAGFTPVGYRKMLRSFYRELVAQTRRGGVGESVDPE